MIGEQGTCFTIRWAEIAQGEIILSALQKKKICFIKINDQYIQKISSIRFLPDNNTSKKKNVVRFIWLYEDSYKARETVTNWYIF